MMPRSMSAAGWIESLDLKPHPEGGYFRETYRSTGKIPAAELSPDLTGQRNFCTAIYYLLQADEFSAFHRIRSDEIWHFYAGDSLAIEVLSGGNHQTLFLGQDLHNGSALQQIVPAGAWFAATPTPGSSFVLAGCTVSPGFDFLDFEMAKQEQLIVEYPGHSSLIERMCRRQ